MNAKTPASVTLASPAVDDEALARYAWLSTLPPPQLRREAGRILRCELDVPVGAMRRRVLARLRCLLALPAADATRIAAAFQDARRELEPTEQDVLLEAERDAALDGMSYADYLRLSSLAPWLGEGLSCEPVAPADAYPSLAAALAAAAT